MYELTVAAAIGQRAVRSVAESALPTAPQVLEPEPHVRTTRVRLGFAAALRTTADRLTPAECGGT